MRSKILDEDAISSITPQALAAYVRGEGWIWQEKFGEHSDVFFKENYPELIIPGTTAIGDYTAVVSDIIGILSGAESRPELQVFRDLSGADRDVIRVRAPQAEDDGSVRIEAGVDIFVNAQAMLLSAACSASEPRAAYRMGGNKEASSFMDRVRLGQTEHGSFIVTLLAPVPPALQARVQQDFWPMPEEEPFERLVTRRLASGLQSARKAAEQAVRTMDMAPFRQAISSGVSANLCEALSALIERGEGLDVSITWARTRPTPESRRRIDFSRADGEVFQEAARILRSQEPRPDERLEGYITATERKPSEDNGKVTLKTFVDEKPVSVKAVLPPDLYSLALGAHGNKNAVSIAGDLVRDGQRWKLDNPRGFTIIAEEDDTSD